MFIYFYFLRKIAKMREKDLTENYFTPLLRESVTNLKVKNFINYDIKSTLRRPIRNLLLMKIQKYFIIFIKLAAADYFQETVSDNRTS